MKTSAMLLALATVATLSVPADTPLLESERVFPLEHWHNHASMVVEAPDGGLLVCWFHGSGERRAEAVLLRDARKRKGASAWSAPCLMADAPGYPDANATMLVGPRQRLWL